MLFEDRLKDFEKKLREDEKSPITIEKYLRLVRSAEKIGKKIENDIAKLADLLGHASINTTRIYIITTGNEHRRKMENMGLII